MINGAVINETGLVAVTYYQPIPKYIRIESTDIVFTCQYGVSLAWVPENLVPKLLSHLGGCCGHNRNVVYLANPAQVSHWKDGKGGR